MDLLCNGQGSPAWNALHNQMGIFFYFAELSHIKRWTDCIIKQSLTSFGPELHSQTLMFLFYYCYSIIGNVSLRWLFRTQENVRYLNILLPSFINISSSFNMLYRYPVLGQKMNSTENVLMMREVSGYSITYLRVLSINIICYVNSKQCLTRGQRRDQSFQFCIGILLDFDFIASYR